MSEPDRYAVIGNPIKHSKSPRIHAAFAEQTGEDLVYDALLGPLDGFADTVAEFRAGGGRGLNVTVPFKEQAFELADELNDRARRAGAVNTLCLEPDRIVGHNTDGIGLYRDLTANHGLDLAGKRILIIGAGGAVRGVLQPLLEAQPTEIRLANRTGAKATELAADFQDLGPITGGGLEAIPNRPVDLVINGTSASLEGKLPPLPDRLLAEGGCAYDMMYAPEPTVFMRWAEEHGAGQALDGLGMLVEQAAESFFIWRGKRPDTGPVIAMLRETSD